jgi:hypothetical protein
MLEVCAIPFVCNAIEDENINTADIFNNAIGCESVAVVEAACGSSCPTGDVTLTTQAEVDAFVVQYPNCTEIDGNLRIAGNIGNLDSLSNITDVNGNLELIQAGNNINTSGLQNITSIGGKLEVRFFGGITNLDFLQDLTSIGGLHIQNSSVNNIQGLANVSGALTGGILIESCPNLTSLNGLQNITSLNDRLVVGQIPLLTDLTGLNGLTSVNNNSAGTPESVWILMNNSLTSINGLENITSLNASNLPDTSSGFSIFMNPNLNDINALSNVTNIVDRISIQNNPMLANCAIASVCNKLAITTSGVPIANNATGCQSTAVVQSACALSSDLFDLSNVSVFPVPFRNEITVQLKDAFGKTQVSIVDLTGKTLVQRTSSESEIQINGLDGLANGVYLLQIESNGGIYTQKIIK